MNAGALAPEGLPRQVGREAVHADAGEHAFRRLGPLLVAEQR